MASGEDVRYSCCSICQEDGINTVARHYCVDCETYFCTRCVKCHRIPSLKSHQINDVNTSGTIVVDDNAMSIQSSEVQLESTSSLRCTLHRGKLIDTFCKDHNEVCCGACVLVKHRSCTRVLIATAAKDFKSSPDLKKFKEALTENLVQCKQEKKKRDDNLDGIGKQEAELLQEVDKYEEEVIAKIKELANISRNKIRSIYGEHKTDLDTDIDALDVVIATNTECVDKLDQPSDEQLFIHAKTNKNVPKDGEMLLQALKKDWKRKEILFSFDQTLKKRVFEMKSLGKLGNKKAVPEKSATSGAQSVSAVPEVYQATFQSNVLLKQSQDAHSRVYDMCFTQAKDLLVIDYGNNKLKRFNYNLQFKDEIALSGYPSAVCEIDKNEVAVRIYNTKVQFVSVGQSMQLTSSFTLASNGFGMMYDVGTGEIFMCEENKVISVYSKTGNRLRTYDKDTNGEHMFSACRQIALSENKQDIYVTDQNKGLIVLDKNGTLKLKVLLSGVSGTWPLCLLPGGICLTGGCGSDVIVQVDKDGKQVGNLIDSTDGRTHTWCAVYDREQSRLLVGGYPGVISVYTLSAKYK